LIVDFAKVEYLDSSALGMLLVLKDQMQEANKMLTLTQPNKVTVQKFYLAGFYNIFTIKLFLNFAEVSSTQLSS
jgi:anti-anti-sigma factor